MKTVRQRIAENIAMVIDGSGMTKSEFAEKFGVTTAAVTNWVMGRSSIDIDRLDAISMEFDIPLSVLLGAEETGGDAHRLEMSFLSLNERGRRKVMEYTDDLCGLAKYTEKRS